MFLLQGRGKESSTCIVNNLVDSRSLLDIFFLRDEGFIQTCLLYNVFLLNQSHRYGLIILLLHHMVYVFQHVIGFLRTKISLKKLSVEKNFTPRQCS